MPAILPAAHCGCSEFLCLHSSGLLRIVRRTSGSVVSWRRAQMVLLSAQRMDVPPIAKVTFTSEDRVRAVIHNFNADGRGFPVTPLSSSFSEPC